MHERIAVPRCYVGNKVQNETPAPSLLTPNTFPTLADAMLYFPSLFLREFVSTICLLVLSSRLSGDLFIAGPLVTLYVNVVFRRPLNNPFVLTLACMSSGNWRSANVAGYPGFDANRTRWWEMLLYWAWLLGAELSAACTAAVIRAHNDSIMGYEFIKGAAWGAGQLHFNLKRGFANTCWNEDYFPPNTTDIPVRLNHRSMLRDGCLGSVQWRWWFAEDLGAVLFLIVAYVHIWRWLRWDDMQQKNPTPLMERYWEKIISFSSASAALGVMTAIAFPTANAGLHTSLFLSVYQSLAKDRNVISNELNEPLIRAAGGVCGCLLAVLYEWTVSWVDSSTPKDAMAGVVHKLVYLMPMPEGGG